MGKLIGFACLVVAGVLYFFAYRLGHRLEEYEFNHTTQGGVVEFENYKAAKSHERKKGLVKLLTAIMLPFFFIGGILVMVGKSEF